MTPSNPRGLREEIARIVDPEAFTTIRQIAAANGLDAANPPTGVLIMEDIDALIANREPARLSALAKSSAILALMVDEELAGRLEARAAIILNSDWNMPDFIADLRLAATRLRGQGGGGTT